MALYLVIRVCAFLSRIIPRSWRYLIGTAVGDVVFFVWPSKRRVVVNNMATVLGMSPRDPQVRRLALKSMRNYCKYLIEFLELPFVNPLDDRIASFTITGWDHVEAAIERGRGLIIATAHFGALEVPGLRLAQHTEFHAVYDAFTPDYLDRLIQEKRREKKINPVPVGNVRAMMKILKSGQTLALLFDKPIETGKGVPVRFFGRETVVPGGPAVLAMRTGAALLPCFTFRHPDRTFESVVFPPISCASTGNRARDTQAAMQKLMDSLQTVVRERPDQWYMFRPMWPVRDACLTRGDTLAVQGATQEESAL
jgi:lauroyl/myristoyl acyltransferase